jgi:elongation of very long chain fatty acids protein 7
MLHGFQLAFYDDCGFPWKFSYYIAAHAVLFFVLFSKFYIKAYIRPKKLKVTSTFCLL